MDENAPDRYSTTTISYSPKTGLFRSFYERGNWVDGKWVRHGEQVEDTHTSTQGQLREMALSIGMRIPPQTEQPVRS